jgi:hypothetical protein
MTVPGTLLPNSRASIAEFRTTGYRPIAGIWLRLMRRSKFSPESRMPAYLPITDIEKSISSWNPFLTSRPKSTINVAPQ